MRKNNKKIEEAQELLIRATRLLTEMIEGNQGNSSKDGIEDWMKDRIELWCRIHNEGGLVTKKRLHEIWTKMGKDTRGIGGFFAGKNSSLQVTHDGKVILTKNATNFIEAWTGKSIEELAKKYK